MIRGGGRRVLMGGDSSIFEFDALQRDDVLELLV